MSFNALVLAGGQSKRMGRDKALLTLPNGQPLYRHAIELAGQAGAGRVWLNSNSIDATGTNVLRDTVENAGPVAGIQVGLQATGATPLLVIPVDMPGLDADLLRQLVTFGLGNACSCYFNEQCLPLFIYDTLGTLAQLNKSLGNTRAPSIWQVAKYGNAQAVAASGQNGLENLNSYEQWQDFVSKL